MSDGRRKNPSSGGPWRPSMSTVAPSAGAFSMYEATPLRWASVISGPMWFAGSVPSPTLMLGMRRLIASTSGSATSANGDHY
jgi:hypothetical protein